MTPLEILQLDISLSKKIDMVYDQVDLCIIPDTMYGIAFTIPNSALSKLEADYKFIINNIEEIVTYKEWKSFIICYITRGCTRKNEIANYAELYEIFRLECSKIGYNDSRFNHMMSGLEPD